MTMARGTTQSAVPYRPSWVDQLNEWIGQRRLPSWMTYLTLGAGLVLVAWLVLRASGITTTGTFLRYYALSGLGQAYLLGLIRHLDHSAQAALARFRPVMTVDEAGYERLRYELTTMPAGPALIAFGLGAAYAIGSLLVSATVGLDPSRKSSPPLVIALLVVHSVLASSLAALLVYHTIHQLRTVSRIYTEHTRINLFQVGPLYALSNLAARTAIGISGPTYLWFWLNFASPSGLSLSDILLAAFFSTIIVVTFVWPLLGAHRLLDREKQRLRDEVARRIEVTMAALHGHIDTGQPDDTRGALKNTLDALVIEQGVIQKLRTWPWQTEAISSVAAAFLVPMIVWVIQRLLQRLGV
jgi:hypothetical protein